jgi:DNA-binding beta-propeller fold protein YncE
MMQNYNYKLATIFFTGILLSAFMPETCCAVKVTAVKHLFDLKHDFLQPSDVTVDKNGNIYVMDGVNHCVKVFDKYGSFRFSFGRKGTENGHFNSPLGICTDAQNRIYVADSGNHRVQVFSQKGIFLSSFQIKNPNAKKLSDPSDLIIDDKRKRIYVVDNDNHNILIYSLTDFSLINSLGTEGEGMQELKHPFLITLGKDTSIIVSDVLNTRVQIWSPKGKAIHSIGEYGVDLGQLYRPKGVAVDKDNNVFVSDSYVGAIQVFNIYGYFLSVVGNEKGEVLKWTTPVGITIDKNQRLYVVEMLLNQISVYQLQSKE